MRQQSRAKRAFAPRALRCPLDWGSTRAFPVGSDQIEHWWCVRCESLLKTTLHPAHISTLSRSSRHDAQTTLASDAQRPNCVLAPWLHQQANERANVDFQNPGVRLSPKMATPRCIMRRQVRQELPERDGLDAAGGLLKWSPPSLVQLVELPERTHRTRRSVRREEQRTIRETESVRPHLDERCEASEQGGQTGSACL
jgi:hypothetical protein